MATAAELAPALSAAAREAGERGLPAFVVVATDRKANVAVHAELDAAVRLRLSYL
jgi:hypothetical protein